MAATGAKLGCDEPLDVIRDVKCRSFHNKDSPVDAGKVETEEEPCELPADTRSSSTRFASQRAHVVRPALQLRWQLLTKPRPAFFVHALIGGACLDSLGDNRDGLVWAKPTNSSPLFVSFRSSIHPSRSMSDRASYGLKQGLSLLLPTLAHQFFLEQPAERGGGASETMRAADLYGCCGG